MIVVEIWCLCWIYVTVSSFLVRLTVTNAAPQDGISISGHPRWLSRPTPQSPHFLICRSGAMHLGWQRYIHHLLLFWCFNASGRSAAQNRCGRALVLNNIVALILFARLIRGIQFFHSKQRPTPLDQPLLGYGSTPQAEMPERTLMTFWKFIFQARMILALSIRVSCLELKDLIGSGHCRLSK